MENLIKKFINTNRSKIYFTYKFNKSINKNFFLTSNIKNNFTKDKLICSYQSNSNKISQISKSCKFNFSSIIKPNDKMHEDPFKNKLSLEATLDIQEIKNMQGKRLIPFDTIIKLLSKLDRIDSSQRLECESLILEILRSPSFYDDYLKHPEHDLAHKSFTEIFANSMRISTLSDEDMATLHQYYFDLDKLPREFVIQERTILFDSFYYYKRSFGEERFKKNLSKIYAHVIKNFLEYFTSFTHIEILPIIQNIMFLSDEEVQVFALRMVDKMNYVINPEYAEKMRLSLQKKVELVQYYPRILHTIRTTHPAIFEREKERIEKFLVENIKEIADIQPEFVICLVSNYLVWTSRSELVIETYVPFFYRNLASFKPELTLELFFLLLNSNFNNYKNPKKVSSLINLIYQTMKNSQVTRLFTFEILKEAFYFNEIREKMDAGFEKWDEKEPAESFEHPDHYYKKLFRIMVKKSSDLYPFSAMEYNDQLFDTIFTNLKQCLQF